MSKIEPALEAVFDSGKVLTRFELLSNIPTRQEVVHWTATHFAIRDGRGKLKQVGAFVIERGVPKRQSMAMSTRLFERLLVNALQTQEPLIRFSSLEERSLAGYHRARVFVKLNLDSLAGLVRYAIRNRLAEL